MSDRMLPGQPVGSKPIGFRTLQECTGFIAMHDGNIVKMTIVPLKVIKLEAKDPQGLPIYNVTPGFNFVVLTKAEYEAQTAHDIKP